MGQEYLDAMARGSELIEEHATRLSVSRVEELARIFIHATNVMSMALGVVDTEANLPQMEMGFWDMGLRAATVSR